MTFKKIACSVCQQQISNSGAAYTSHMRMHVRLKEAVEHKRNGKLLFLRADQNIIDTEPYAKLGNDPLPGQPKDVWIMPDLKTYLPAIDPHSYFITSGEAVKKAEKLVKDVYALATKCRAFRDKLVKARGIKKYLETVRDPSLSNKDLETSSGLLIKSKNPRSRKEEDEGEEPCS